MDANEREGIVKNIAPNPPFSAVQTVNINWMSTHVSSYKMLKAHPDVSGIMHGFSYSPEAAKQFIDLGFKIGIGSMLLNPKARKIKEVVKLVPAEHLVIETDCPFGIEENSTALKHAEILKQIKAKA